MTHAAPPLYHWSPMLEAATVKIKVEPDDKQRKPAEPAKSPAAVVAVPTAQSHPAETGHLAPATTGRRFLLPGV